VQTASKWRYYPWLLTRPTLLGGAGLVTILRLLPFYYHAGIRIVVSPFGEIENDVFVASLRAALEILREFDPLRYSRVRRCIRTVHATRLRRAIAGYWPIGRMCEVNWPRILGLTDQSTGRVLALADVLVHEATHGAVFARFIAYDRARRHRVEALCKKEERRFRRRMEETMPRVTERVTLLLSP